MKVSLIQIHSGEDKQANFKKAQDWVLEALVEKPDIVCLSENFLYRGNDRNKEAEELSSSYIQAFRGLALQRQVNLILGSIILRTSSAKDTNSSLAINRQGAIVHRYDKIYMYDVERPDLSFRESAAIEPGRSVGFFENEGVKIGVGICVDLRYPEYFRALARLNTDVVFLPSNFRRLTGELAWDLLTRARAIENQTYFCACSQTGGSGAEERCGCSRIVSFDGTILAEIGREEGVVSADLDFAAQAKFRREFPVLRQMDHALSA